MAALGAVLQRDGVPCSWGPVQESGVVFPKSAVMTGVSVSLWQLNALIYSFIVQTSIMAVEFDGGVIIGADSRTSSG